jgi:hypothetical protein
MNYLLNDEEMTRLGHGHLIVNATVYFLHLLSSFSLFFYFFLFYFADTKQKEAKSTAEIEKSAEKEFSHFQRCSV